MDTDVLAQILARAVDPAELKPAALPRHRRHAVFGCTYPVLRPATAGSVDGVLFSPIDNEERRRIDHFESGEYEARPRRVSVEGHLTNALVYVDLDGAFELAAGAWSLETWQAQHKAGYLVACDGWMADYAAARVSVPAGRSAAWPVRPMRSAKDG